MEMISVRKNILLDLVTEYMFATTDCYDCLFQDVCQAKKSDINYIGTCVETAMEFLASGETTTCVCLKDASDARTGWVVIVQTAMNAQYAY